MNVLYLFETKNIEDIKLGLQLVKTLHLENEFTTYFKRSFIKYEDIFNNVVLLLEKETEFKFYFDSIIDKNLKINKLYYYNIPALIDKFPFLINYFDLSKMSKEAVSFLVYKKPGNMLKFDLSKITIKQLMQIGNHYAPKLIKKLKLEFLGKSDIYWVLQTQPKIRKLFQKTIDNELRKRNWLINL